MERDRELTVTLCGWIVLGLMAAVLGRGAFATPAIQVERLFIPTHFDDNDEVVVVADGWRENSCVIISGADVKIDLENAQIVVQLQSANVGEICIPVRERFSEVVEVGKLPYGNYQVMVGGADVEKALLVAESDNAGPDDHLYAHVDTVWLDSSVDAEGHEHLFAVMEGAFMDTCEYWDSISVNVDGDIIEVFPVIRRVGDQCIEVLRSFTVQVEMPLPDAGERKLVHVRVANGNSLNRVFSY